MLKGCMHTSFDMYIDCRVKIKKKPKHLNICGNTQKRDLDKHPDNLFTVYFFQILIPEAQLNPFAHSWDNGEEEILLLSKSVTYVLLLEKNK